MVEVTESTLGIAVIVFVGGLVALTSFGVLDMLRDDTRTHAQIDNKEEMMKLVLYDSMIAYNCKTGGNLDDPNGNDGDLYWGSWSKLRGIWKNPALGEITFDELNKSMPINYRGMPCYATESTLPVGSGGVAQETSLAGKEWKDDQHGKRSRIKFEANSSFTLPHCFTHYTQDTFPSPHGGTGDMYERISGDQVTDSWFLVTDEQEKSAFHKGGAGQGTSDIDMHYNCEEIANSGTKDNGSGPIMTVNLIDSHLVSDLPLVSAHSPKTMGGGLPQPSDTDIADFTGGFDFFEAYSSSPDDPRPLKEYEFLEGTKGYVQTNIGCNPGSPPYALSNSPGQTTGEITDKGKCANTLHPFIVITKLG